VSAPTEPRPDGSRPSWGNISDAHWSRARKDSNQEALAYYRERSHAPGVREGGEERNFYCMECDGVIPYDPATRACPHCGATLDAKARRYFNWVEINEPAESDLRALLPLLLGGALVLATALVALIAWLA